MRTPPRRRRPSKGTAVATGVTVALVGAALVAPAAADEPELTTWVPTGVFASSSFERVDQTADEELAEAAPQVLEISAPRNAPSSAQLVVTAHEDLSALEVEVRPTGSEDRPPLPPEAVTVRYAGYVPLEGTSEVIADPLLDGPVDVDAGHNQPVWLTIDVPPGLAAGEHGIELAVAADGVEPVVHELVVDVADVTLHDAVDYEFYLNLWMQPDAVAYANDVEVFSEEHWQLLDPYLQDLVTRGQQVINAAIIEDPWELGWPDGSWSAQTYYPFHSLVDWSHDGESWSFDYANFDRYVQASLDAGIGPDIRVYALLLFGGRERLYYEDTTTGEMVSEVVELGGERWRDAWAAFLTDFEAHLRDQGWFEDTMLAFDERPSATMDPVLEFLEDEAPAFRDKIHIAVHSPDVDHTLPDVSYIHGLLPELEEVLDERREAGLLTTFYNVFAPEIPNTLTTSPPVSSRLLPWVAVQYGLDGYLRWTYNSWPSDDPYTDTAFRYSQGDEYLVFPGEDGPVSTIRWETFRDGVVDHELLTELARRAGEHNTAYREALEMLDATTPPSAELYADVLTAHTLVVDELEQFGDVAVSVTVEPDGAVAGDALDLAVQVDNEGDAPLVDAAVGLSAPEGWDVVAAGQAADVAPGDELTARFTVTVPDSAATGTAQLAATVTFEQDGEPITLTSPVPVDVLAAVGVLDVVAHPQEPAIGEGVEVEATVVSRLPEPVVTDGLSLAVPDGWTVTPEVQAVELEPGARTTVTFRAEPTARADAGRVDLTAGVAMAGEVVEDATASVFYNEAGLPASVHWVSSEEVVGEEGAAEHLVDGDPDTHWHTRWRDATDEYPHEVVLDLGDEELVHALTYLPRQTGTLNGTVADYEVYVSSDAETWGEPVTTGTFAGTRTLKRADFAPTTGRYVRFVALAEIGGQDFASGAELGALGRLSTQWPDPEPAVVTPEAVTFTDGDGTEDGSYTVPAVDGVQYVLGGEVIEAGTYPGEGTVTITARAAEGYQLAEGATAEWTHTFSTEPGDPGPGPRSPEFHLSNDWRGTTHHAFQYGRSADEVLIGDWDGDGSDSIAVRRGAVFHIGNGPRGGEADQVFSYGRDDDVILVGDWDGDGRDTFAVRRGSEYHVKNRLIGGEADQVVHYGRAADQVLVGDWDASGRDSFAVRRGNEYHVANSVRGGPADHVFWYGRAGDTVLVGDWDADGADTLAVRRAATYHVRNALSGGDADLRVTFGRPGDEVFVGDWDGDGADTLGIRRGATDAGR